jgi:hypothetical protein
MRSESSECNCPIHPEPDRGPTICNIESENGNLCGKPADHEGPHAACSVNQHPVEVWGE